MTLRLQVDELRELMHDFYVLTGIKMTFFDNEYQEIISFPEEHCGFCRIMHSIPETRAKCIKSNEYSFETCKKSNQLLIYQCHAGLFEATAPLLDEGIVIGYIMMGQVIDEKDNISCLEKYYDICKQYGIFSQEYNLALNSVTSASKEQVLAAAKILEACTLYVLFKQLINIEKDRFIFQLNQYIDQHINDDISVQYLCEEFNISRTKLYELSSHYLGMGIGEHIRNKRVERAKYLLQNTSYPISDIANMVGFQDYNYFCKVFKKVVEMSAKKYRSLQER